MQLSHRSNPLPVSPAARAPRLAAAALAVALFGLALGCGGDPASLDLPVSAALYEACSDPDQCLAVIATWCVRLTDGSLECTNNDVDLSLVLPGGSVIGRRGGQFPEANGCLHAGDETAEGLIPNGLPGPYSEQITCSPATQPMGPPAIESGTYVVEIRDDFSLFDTGNVVVDVNVDGEHARYVVNFDDGSTAMIPIAYDHDPGAPPVVPTGPSTFAIGSGFDHTCAIDDAGLACWGRNLDGQTTVPGGLSNPREVGGGDDFTCVLEDTGVVCWGDNTFAQTAAPSGLSNPRGLSVGPLHSCLIDDFGVACWGDNSHGQLNVPGGLVNPVVVEAGGQHTCALHDAGVTCWGTPGSFNVFGQQIVPAGLSNPYALAVGVAHTCALHDAGLRCWGRSSDGEQTPPRTLVNPSAVTIAGGFTCVRDDVGLTCFGQNDDGQTNVRAGIASPTAVAMGGRHACALEDEAVVCWGSNGNGQSTVPERFTDMTGIP